MGNLVKVNFEDIGWNLGREGFFYRGNSQGKFERRVLESLVNNKDPKYYGVLDEGKKLTFCSNSFMIGIGYTSSWIEKQLKFNRELELELFSKSPLIMEINANRYRDKIFESTSGDGLIIEGDINLDDIEIIYNGYINKLMEKNPLKNHPNYIASIQRFVEICEKSGLLKEDLIASYKRIGLRRTISKLYLNAFGAKIVSKKESDTKEETRLIEEYIRILRSKLR